MPIRHSSQSHPLGEGHLSFPHHRFRHLSFHGGLNLMLHLHASTVRRHIWPAMVCCSNSIQLISIPLEIFFLLFHFPLRVSFPFPALSTKDCYLRRFFLQLFHLCVLSSRRRRLRHGLGRFGHKTRGPFAPETGNRGVRCLPHKFVRWFRVFQADFSQLRERIANY